MATAGIAVGGAIYAAGLQAKGAVTAQETAQARITERELARQKRIDDGVRAQVESYLSNIAFGAEFLVEAPLATEVSIVPAEIRDFAKRVKDLDVATAFSTQELRALLNTATLLRNAPELIESKGKAAAPSSGEDVSDEQALATMRYQAFTVGLHAARAAAVTGHYHTLQTFRKRFPDSRTVGLRQSLFAAYPGLTSEHLGWQPEAADAQVVQGYLDFDPSAPRNGSAPG